MDWKDKTILITGGTGSFGKKFTKIALEEKQPKKIIIFLTPASRAASTTFAVPMIFVLMASIGLYSQVGTCFSAAAWTTISTPCMARTSRSRSLTSPMK